MQKIIKIITEGGQNFGFGHVVRCKALCDAFLALGHNSELIIQGDDSLLSILDNHHVFCNWHNSLEEISLYCQNADICIIDSYHASLEYYNAISNVVKVFAFFDDTYRLNYQFGVLLNGSFHVSEEQYPQIQLKTLLGIDYQCIRKEFWNQKPREISKVITKVVITVGGNDVRNLIPQLLHNVQKTYPDSKIAIIIGATSPNIETLYKIQNNKISLHINANVDDVIRLMQEADLAISASGQTLCELACCGLPSISVSVIDNQFEHAKAWHNDGCFDFAGSWDESGFWEQFTILLQKYSQASFRYERSLKIQSIIDGKGAIRVASYLLKQIPN